MTAIGIPRTDITAGTKVIGLALRIPAPAGLVHAHEGGLYFNGYWEGDRGRFEHRHEWDRDRDRDRDRWREHEDHHDDHH